MAGFVLDGQVRGNARSFALGLPPSAKNLSRPAAETDSASVAILPSALLQPIEVVTAQITVIALLLLQVVRNDQNAVSDRDDGTLFAKLGGKAVDLHRKVSIL